MRRKQRTTLDEKYNALSVRDGDMGGDNARHDGHGQDPHGKDNVVRHVETSFLGVFTQRGPTCVGKPYRRAGAHPQEQDARRRLKVEAHECRIKTPNGPARDGNEDACVDRKVAGRGEETCSWEECEECSVLFRTTTTITNNNNKPPQLTPSTSLSPSRKSSFLSQSSLSQSECTREGACTAN